MNNTVPLQLKTKDYFAFARFLDRWIGGGFLFILGCVFRRRRTVPQDVRSVLMIKFDGLGDLVLVTGVARDLRAAWPRARLILLCGPFNYPLASLLSTFDQFVCLNVSRPFETLRELRRLAPDICIDLGEWSRIEALLAFFCKARWTIGFQTPGQFRHYAYDCRRPLRFDRHELDNYRSLLQPLNLPTGQLPCIELTDTARLRLPRFHPVMPYAVLHLWSGSAKWACLKEWPMERWQALARRLNERNLQVYLTGSRNDVPRATAFIANCRWSGVCMESVAGCELHDLIQLLRSARIVVSIDTSITHIAAALEAPVLSLHGHSSSKRWGPIGPRAEAVDTTCPGCGYMNWGADSDRQRAGLPCMEAITFEEVAGRVDSMLDRYAEATYRI
ncbi:MAG: glycosyltransferase family 9 protein [Verrucomicrobiota bacterium]